jgi:hypothetical protein
MKQRCDAIEASRFALSKSRLRGGARVTKSRARGGYQILRMWLAHQYALLVPSFFNLIHDLEALDRAFHDFSHLFNTFEKMICFGYFILLKDTNINSAYTSKIV